LSAEEIWLLQEAMKRLESLAEQDDAAAINTGVEMVGKASEEFAGLRMDASVRQALAGHKIDELEEGTN
jgi:molecular chaperone HscA